MKTKITQLGFGQVLEVELKEGESLFSESGAFLAGQGDITLEAKMLGGIISGALRSLAGGESPFINKITAESDSTVVIGAPFPGEIAELTLEGESFVLGDGAYLAHTGEIEISAEFGFLNSLLAGSGLLFLKASGKGKLFICGEAGLQKVELNEGETLILDNSALVAVDEGATIERMFMGKGLKSKLLSGEGVVFKITGPAQVFYKAANTASFANILRRYLKA